MITNYSDSGIDKTDLLTAVSIQFNSTGDFLVFKNDSVVSGNWNIEDQIGLDKLNIIVHSQQMPYSTFGATWYAYDHTTNTIRLSNASLTVSETIQLQRI